MSDDLTIVSHEHEGRILTGVGADPDDLAAVMEREAPEPATDPAHGKSALPRNEAGQFAKPSRGQKRFDQLTAERETEKRAREAAEKERDDLRQQLEVARRPAPVEPEKPAKPTLPDHLKTYDAFLATEPNAEYEEFRDARNLWLYQQQIPSLDLDAQIRRGIEADRASRTAADKFTEAQARGRQAYPDFDAVLQAPHMLEPWPPDKLAAIARLDAIEHIQYGLAKDPELAARLKDADPVTFGMALAKLIPSTAVAQFPASTARTVVPPPPAPYQPVAGGGKSTGPSSADLATRGSTDYDTSGYREKRAAERGVSRRW